MSEIPLPRMSKSQNPEIRIHALCRSGLCRWAYWANVRRNMKYLSPKLQLAAVKACIVLVPCSTMAYLTEQMVFVVPTLAATAFFASTIEMSDLPQRRVDEDSEDGDAEGSEYDPDNPGADGYQETLTENTDTES